MYFKNCQLFIVNPFPGTLFQPNILCLWSSLPCTAELSDFNLTNRVHYDFMQTTVKWALSVFFLYSLLNEICRGLIFRLDYPPFGCTVILFIIMHFLIEYSTKGQKENSTLEPYGISLGKINMVLYTLKANALSKKILLRGVSESAKIKVHRID